MTACNAVIECRHKIAFVNTLPIEKWLPWPLVWSGLFIFAFVPIYILIYSSIIFMFISVQSWVLVAGTNRWLQPLLFSTTWSPWQEKKNLQAVNESSSMPGAKGDYKLTEAFVMALFCSILFPALSLLIFCPHSLLSVMPFPLLFNFLRLPACFTLQQHHCRSSSFWLWAAFIVSTIHV